MEQAPEAAPAEEQDVGTHEHSVPGEAESAGKPLVEQPEPAAPASESAPQPSPEGATAPAVITEAAAAAEKQTKPGERQRARPVVQFLMYR